MSNQSSKEFLRKLKRDVNGIATRGNKINDNQIIFLNFILTQEKNNYLGWIRFRI